MTQGWSFIRILVFPDSKKNRLPETIIPRPLREFYLTDHRRFDPMATFHFGSSQPWTELASKLGMFPTNLRKYAIKHGFQFVRARMLTGGGRQVIALPPEVKLSISLNSAKTKDSR